MRRVRDQTSYDLAEMFTKDGLLRLHGDVYLMVDVLWALCEPQAAGRQVDQYDFARRLVGNAIEEAADALLQAGLNFLPPARRTTTEAMMRKLKTVGQEIEQQIRREVEKLSPTDVLASSGESSPRWRG